VDHILVIDDDKDFVRLLGRLLDDPVRRYDIISAHSGYEGLDWLTRRTPDLILLDLELPDIHGTEIITRLRECEEWRDIPVVVLSGQEEIDRAQVLDGGMLVSRANGLVPGELVQWIQCVVDTVTQAAVPGAGSPVRPPPAR
jgi:CheY-like chemotaxis protein